MHSTASAFQHDRMRQWEWYLTVWRRLASVCLSVCLSERHRAYSPWHEAQPGTIRRTNISVRSVHLDHVLHDAVPLSILTATVVVSVVLPIPTASAFSTIPNAPSPSSLPIVSLPRCSTNRHNDNSLHGFDRGNEEVGNHKSEKKTKPTEKTHAASGWWEVTQGKPCVASIAYAVG